MSFNARVSDSEIASRVNAWKASKETPYEAPRPSGDPSGAVLGFAVTALAGFIMGLVVGWFAHFL